MIWMNTAIEMNPVNWDWKHYGDEVVAVMCNMNAAPDTLLKNYTLQL